jgi:hypothetical protein
VLLRGEVFGRIVWRSLAEAIGIVVVLRLPAWVASPEILPPGP